MFEPVGDYGHYYHLLVDAGVPVTISGKEFDPRFPSLIKKVPGGLRRVHELPPECRPVILDVLGELLVDRPDVLHTWLDASNVWGGMAGVLAEVPHIVLSTRNVNPSNFPVLDIPYYRQAYSALLRSPNVRVINNSRPGAEDYADWLGIPAEQITVVLNGLDVSRLHRVSDQEAARFRAATGIPANAPVIAGVFRLAEEKQPLVFLESFRRVACECANAVAVIAGIGPLEEQMRHYVAEHHLTDRVIFLGRLADVSPLYNVAALTLLCSRKEGTPNVLLEAQWLGCPVVSTRAGGAVDAVADGETGYLLDVGDVAGLSQAVLRLLQDASLRQRMAANGPAFIQSKFSVERMVLETLHVYGIRHDHTHAH
jgi:glycosyltransferase involved in cell wall biosynthesis